MRFAFLSLLLSGCIENGVSRIKKEDDFAQDGGSFVVDFLWVVDNSGSMSEEQDSVVESLGSFVEVLDSFGADWQVGVTTTAGEDDDGGVIVAPVITSQEADATEQFQAAVAVGTEGDISEQGLLSAQKATSSALLATSNSGLIRDEAVLSVIVVSDEDDQSPDDVSTYVDALEALKGESNVRLSAVVGDLPAGCASPYAAADPAERYLDAVTMMNGVSDSICRKDLSDTMKALALNGLGLTDTFALTAVPELESMEVRVDGVLVHQRDLNGWRYDAGLNAVILDGYAIPGPGSEVEIRYYEWLGYADDGSTDTGQGS